MIAARECVSEHSYGDHMYVTVYERPRRRLFRKTTAIRCWYCNIRVLEPA